MSENTSCGHGTFHSIDVKEENGEEWVEYECNDCPRTWWEKSG